MSDAPTPPDARPIRVLFVDHTAKLGGGEIALLNLVAALPRGRVTPEVALFEDGPLAGRLRSAGVAVHVLPLGRAAIEARKDRVGVASLLKFGAIAAALSLALRLARFVRRGGYDLVHCNSLKADLIGGFAGRLARRPVVWHVHDRIADDYLPARTAANFRRLARLVPHGVVVNSRATLATLDLPADLPRVVAHPGLPPAALRAGKRPHVANSPPTVVLVGRLAEWKGQREFVRAAKIVLDRHPNARFQIVGSALFGEETYAAEVRNLIASLGLAGRVEMLGFRDDAADLLAAATVAVHASLTPEPFGQVVVEAMAAGTPVVATAAGGVLEIVEDGVSGLLVPPGDVAAMAGAVVRLLDDPSLAAELSDNARRRVADLFTIERTADAVLGLYDAVLAARG